MPQPTDAKTMHFIARRRPTRPRTGPDIITTLPSELLAKIYKDLPYPSNIFFYLTCCDFHSVAIGIEAPAPVPAPFRNPSNPDVHERIFRLQFLHALQPFMDPEYELCSACFKWKAKKGVAGWWEIPWKHAKPQKFHTLGGLDETQKMKFCGKHVMKMQAPVYANIVNVK